MPCQVIGPPQHIVGHGALRIEFHSPQCRRHAFLINLVDVLHVELGQEKLEPGVIRLALHRCPEPPFGGSVVVLLQIGLSQVNTEGGIGGVKIDRPPEPRSRPPSSVDPIRFP